MLPVLLFFIESMILHFQFLCILKPFKIKFVLTLHHILLLYQVTLILSIFFHLVIISNLFWFWHMDLALVVLVFLCDVIHVIHGFFVHVIMDIFVFLCPVPLVFYLFFCVVVEMPVPFLPVKAFIVVFHLFLLVSVGQLLLLVNLLLQFLLLLHYLISFQAEANFIQMSFLS